VRDLSSRARQSAYAQETDEVWLYLLTIEEGTLGEPLRFVNNGEAIKSDGKLYLPFPFTFIAPGQSDDEPGEATIDIDNVDLSIVTTLRAMVDPPSITIQAILASQPDVIEASVSGLTLRFATYDKDVVSGTLQFEDLITEPITIERTPARFPAMF